MNTPDFDLPSGFTRRLPVSAILVAMLLFSSLPMPACLGEEVQLNAETPIPADTLEPAKEVHKLQVTKEESLAAPERNPHITGNEGNIPIDIRSLGTTIPLVQLRALTGRPADEHQLFAERDTGYGVCGLVMNVPVERRAYVSIRKVFASMPADQANLQAGDVIVSVNGTSTRDIPSAQVWDYFTGTPGADVQLEMMRGNHPFSVTLKRMDIGHIPDERVRAAFLTIFQMRGGNLHPLQD